MSQDLTKLIVNEKVILSAHLETKTEGGAAELRQLLTAIKKRTDNAELGCSAFRVTRFDKLFMIFEEYEDASTTHYNFESMALRAFMEAGKNIFTKPIIEMSSDLTKLDVSERIILNANLEAKTDEGADDLQRLLLEIKKNTEVAEPGCVAFRVTRFERLFMIFEEYENGAAVNFHFESKAFKTLIERGQVIFAKPPSIVYYKEITA
ncbi:hypothetical protein FRB96_003743 [Tulasnella sp. 330]|nr:hypothetical protein FRB96_003743 [Tulasnella sp. 330]KAG8879792.1 hypothetical protein FRB98_005505 [Tulasnella sp. 332]KAG8880209.1 hypothetical protein FRB97_000978 [Tulasnella sp. 331]